MVNERQKKQNLKKSNMAIGITVTCILTYFCSYFASLMESENVDFVSAFPILAERLSSFNFLFQLNANALTGAGIGLLIGVFVAFLLVTDAKKNYAYNPEETGGTGGFMTDKELEEYNKKYIKPDPEPILKNLPVSYNPETDKLKYSQNMIMSQNFCRPIDARIIGNNSITVVGGAGSGKSRFFVKPNILQMNASYVITDPKGEMLNDLGKCLKEHGYKIKVFNISDMSYSNCYNPLEYIRDEAGVKMIVECLINNTTKGSGGGDNQFFVDAEKLLYSACIFYLLDFCKDDSKKNFSSIINMINSSQVDESNPNAKSPLDLLFEKVPYNSLARQYYRSFKQAAGKTLKSIIISCVTRLQPFLIPQVINLTKIDELELNKLGDEKTALFIITPAADRTYSFLASMLYSQMFETLYFYGEQRKSLYGSEKMPIPVRCIMDEFANIGEIPEFPSKLATMRSYNISACVILQDIAQIEKMYKEDWKTLIGNCSTIIFLGTQEPNTCKYFSDMLGNQTIVQKSRGVSHGGKSSASTNFQNTKREVKTADELARMEPDECIVFTYTMRPVFDKKYDYKKHPYFLCTADADRKNNSFRYKEMSAFDNSKNDHIGSIIKARQEAKRYKEEVKAKKLEEEKIRGNVDEKINDVELLDKDIENKSYSKCIQECIVDATNSYSDKVCIFRKNGIASKYMPKLVSQTSVSLEKPMMVMFKEVEVDGNKRLLGIGVDRKNQGLKEAMTNKYSIGITEKDGYILVVINACDFNDYKDAVNSKILSA